MSWTGVNYLTQNKDTQRLDTLTLIMCMTSCVSGEWARLRELRPRPQEFRLRPRANEWWAETIILTLCQQSSR